eukprot:PLAT1641.3.p1 GENE.PLAT1641.3~~PLAT1641.3.p1  ORF type:complete len:163 (+),score=12.58 PLAT1641.3:2-490(+)
MDSGSMLGDLSPESREDVQAALAEAKEAGKSCGLMRSGFVKCTGIGSDRDCEQTLKIMLSCMGERPKLLVEETVPLSADEADNVAAMPSLPDLLSGALTGFPRGMPVPDMPTRRRSWSADRVPSRSGSSAKSDAGIPEAARQQPPHKRRGPRPAPGLDRAEL